MKEGKKKLKKKKLLRKINKKIDKEDALAWEAHLRLSFVQAEEHDAKADVLRKIVKKIKKMK